MKKCLFVYVSLMMCSVVASGSVPQGSVGQQQAGGPKTDRKTVKWGEIACLPWKDGSGMKWNAVIRVCDNLATYNPATQTLTMGTNTVTDILPEDVQMVDVVVKDVKAVVAATKAQGGKPGWA